jgi:hypothetical protein
VPGLPLGTGRPSVAGATDFTRLQYRHRPAQRPPGGRPLPHRAGPGTDFKDPRRKERAGLLRQQRQQRADANEIRLYNTGEGYEVECASCHDPHGVPSAGPGSTFNPTFLRINNTGSAVCLTCHSK